MGSLIISGKSARHHGDGFPPLSEGLLYHRRVLDDGGRTLALAAMRVEAAVRRAAAAVVTAVAEGAGADSSRQ